MRKKLLKAEVDEMRVRLAEPAKLQSYCFLPDSYK